MNGGSEGERRLSQKERRRGELVEQLAQRATEIVKQTVKGVIGTLPERHLRTRLVRSELTRLTEGIFKQTDTERISVEEKVKSETTGKTKLNQLADAGKHDAYLRPYAASWASVIAAQLRAVNADELAGEAVRGLNERIKRAREMKTDASLSSILKGDMESHEKLSEVHIPEEFDDKEAEATRRVFDDFLRQIIRRLEQLSEDSNP